MQAPRDGMLYASARLGAKTRKLVNNKQHTFLHSSTIGRSLCGVGQAMQGTCGMRLCWHCLFAF